MCGRIKRTGAFNAYVRELQEAGIIVARPAPHQAPNLEPQPDLRPTDPAPIFRRMPQGEGEGVEMIHARWWFVPYWHRGNLKDFKLTTFNAKSETVATSRTFRDSFKQRRCLVPADGWYEWTGEKGAKVKWLFTPKGNAPVCFAGLWDRCKTTDAGEVKSFTIVTQPPNPELLAYHDRAPVVLHQRDWSTWLDLTADVQPLLGTQTAAGFDVVPA